MTLKRFLFVVIFALLILAFGWMSMFSKPNSDRIALDLQLELAAMDIQRKQGLMNRQEMCKTCGMLFDFGGERKVSFWMKDTYIPLDMIMVDNDGVIDTIHTDAIPLNTEKRYPSKGKVRYVIEVNTGFVSRHNLQPGDALDIESLIKDSVPFSS